MSTAAETPSPQQAGPATPQAPQVPYGPSAPYATAPSSPPQAAPPGPYATPPWRAKNWMGVTSLILSLLGLITGVTVIAGIVFGHLSLNAVSHGEADNRSMGLAGLVLGYVLLGVGLVVMVIVFGFAGWVISECAGPDPAAWCTTTP